LPTLLVSVRCEDLSSLGSGCMHFVEVAALSFVSTAHLLWESRYDWRWQPDEVDCSSACSQSAPLEFLHRVFLKLSSEVVVGILFFFGGPACFCLILSVFRQTIPEEVPEPPPLYTAPSAGSLAALYAIPPRIQVPGTAA